MNGDQHHVTDPDQILVDRDSFEYMTPRVRKYADRVLERPQEYLRGIMQDAIRLTCEGVVVAPQDPRIADGARLGADAASLWLAWNSSGDAMTAEFDGRTIALPLPEPRRASMQIHYQEAWHLVWLSRFEPGVQRLLSVGDAFLQGPTSSRDVWNETVIKSIRAFYSGDADALEAAASTWRAETSVDVLPDRRYQPRTRLRVAVAELLAHIAAGRADAFNELLEWMMATHRRYYSASVDYRNSKEEGYVALPALGATCLAYDRGIEITVDSPYLPMWLVRQEFNDEPTPYEPPFDL